jgi:hypothetical protein
MGITILDEKKVQFFKETFIQLIITKPRETIERNQCGFIRKIMYLILI